jgi:hypothetical protein
MAAEVNESLERLQEGQDRIREEQAEILTALRGQGELLRLLTERLGAALEKLVPQEESGPTLQEIMAEMVLQLGDSNAILRRIDRRTESMAASLPDDVARALRDCPGANQDGASGGSPA